jgi:hypothetical protein
VRRAAALAVLAAAFGAGCGGGDPKPEDAARATVQRYLTALGRGDAAAACREFTDSSREKLAEFGGEKLKLKERSCRATIDAALHAGNGAQLRALGHAKITRVRMEQGHAEVAISGVGTTTTVVRSDGAWRIESEPTGETD